MKINNADDLPGTWGVKQYTKKDGTLKVHKKPRGLKLIFMPDGRVDFKVLFFRIHAGWELRDGRLIIHPATKGKPPINVELTEEGLAWDNPDGQRTWFAKIS